MKLKAYKYRLYPSPAQAEFLAKQFGCCRYGYNWALAEKSRAYQERKRGLSRLGLDKRLTSLKKELPWLAEVASQPLQQALISLEKASRKISFRKLRTQSVLTSFERMVYFHLEETCDPSR